MLLRSLVVLVCAAMISGQRKYYNLHDMPDTNFDCRDKILGGYYADPETNCQMFHVCVKIPGQGVQDFRFLCPNETSFDQENQICADSGDIDCEAAGLYLENFDLYRLGSAQANLKRPLIGSSKGTVVPLGPSTKSPILTNNINEDDEFFLQRSDTGDRRLHSKDLLRGSSSSNFFNNRNKGKDLEDDDDEDNIPKTNQEYRPKSSHPVRGKSQYSSQFRKSETTAPPQKSTPQQEINVNQIHDKKRTKIAVRKLTRKRPQNPEEAQDLKTTSQPNYSTFTTQVTQKFNFGEQEQRYNTINRVSTTPSTVSTQARFQSNFRAKTEGSSSTLAFFEPSPTPKAFTENNKEINRELPTVNLQRQPIVAAAVPQNFQNTPNRPATNFQPPFRQTTVVANQSPNQNVQQNKQTTPAFNQNFQQNNNNNNNNFQQIRQNPPVNNNVQQNRPTPSVNSNNNNNNFNNNNFQQRQNPSVNNNNQQQRPHPSVNNNNLQQRPHPSVNNNNNLQQRPNPNVNNNNNNNNFQQRPNPTANNNNNNNNFQQNRLTTPGNFQQNRQTPQVTFQPVKQTPPPNNPQNFQQRSNQQNFQQNRSPSPAPVPLQNRQTTVSTAANRAQTINNAFQSTRPTASPQNLRQYYNRQFDDFEEGDNQEFLKTAPSSNIRPSDLNSFNKNNFKANENFDKNTNVTKFATTATTKYYTPTIVTTPKPSPTFSNRGTSNSFFSTNQPSSFYTPTVTATTKLFKPPSSTLQPPSSGPQPRPFSTTQNQPSTSSAKPIESKDTSYDYAYYDDAGSFSEYDALDALGETDFTRTSQRTKSRLI